MTFSTLYHQKRGTPQDAIELLRDGDFIVVPTGVGEPPTLLEALSEQRQRLHGAVALALVAHQVEQG